MSAKLPQGFSPSFTFRNVNADAPRLIGAAAMPTTTVAARFKVEAVGYNPATASILYAGTCEALTAEGPMKWTTNIFANDPNGSFKEEWMKTAAVNTLYTIGVSGGTIKEGAKVVLSNQNVGAGLVGKTLVGVWFAKENHYGVFQPCSPDQFKDAEQGTFPAKVGKFKPLKQRDEAPADEGYPADQEEEQEEQQEEEVEEQVEEPAPLPAPKAAPSATGVTRRAFGARK